MPDQTETLTEYLARHKDDPRQPFVPHAWYSDAGDMIECFFSDVQCYAKPLAPGVDLYYSQETHEIVGVEIHGVKRLMRNGETRTEGK